MTYPTYLPTPPSGTLEAWIFKVPWYRTTPELMTRWHAAHPGEAFIHYPGESRPYDTGGGWNNIVLKYPGWRAREGFGQSSGQTSFAPSRSH